MAGRAASISTPDEADGNLDFRGSRRLAGLEEWCWYLAAGVSYIVLGIWHKWLLNWLVGPVWLIAVVSIGPAVLDRLRTALGDRRQ